MTATCKSVLPSHAVLEEAAHWYALLRDGTADAGERASWKIWLHTDADEDHGGRGFELLERHCTTRELQEQAIHFARESAKMRWFYFDGIYLHYELGYRLR